MQRLQEPLPKSSGNLITPVEQLTTHTVNLVDERDRALFSKVENDHTTAELASKENILGRTATGRL